MKPDDGALGGAPRLVEQARQRHTAGRFEPYEAADWLGRICRRSASHRHILSRVRCAPPSQKLALLMSMKSTVPSTTLRPAGVMENSAFGGLPFSSPMMVMTGTATLARCFK